MVVLTISEVEPFLAGQLCQVNFKKYSSLTNSMEANGRHLDLRLEELLHSPVALAIFDVNMIKWLDWLQSLKQFSSMGHMYL